jgi:hypothetical protein
MTKKISRVELDNGEVVSIEHPEGWTDLQITNYAALNASQAKRTSQHDASGPANKDDEITNADLVQLGLARFGIQFVPDVFLMSAEEFKRDADLAFSGRERETPMQREERLAREFSGIPADAPLTLTQEMFAAAGDPLSYIGVRAPLKVAEGAIQRQVVPFLKTAIPAVTSTGAGLLGGMTASQLAAEAGASPYAQELAAITAGGLAGATTNVVTAPAIMTLGKVAGDIKTKITGEKTDIFGPASEAMANSQVRAEINRIAQTTRPEEVARAVENLATLKEEIPGLQIGGIVGTMSDNPVVRDWVRKTTQANKGFQKEMEEILVSDAQKLSERFETLAGKVTGEAEDYSVARAQMESIARKSFKAQELASIKKFERQKENIDKALVKLSTRITPDEDGDIISLGQAAQRLSNKREALIRGEADKLYDSTKAIANRIALAPELVKDVYSQFRNVRLADVFGPNSKVGSQLEARWMPRDADGKEVIPKATGTDVISLKKAVNTEISTLSNRARSPEIDQRIERLYKTKGVVNDMLAKMRTTDPEFVNSLANADKFYYEQLGLPMRAEGMKDFTSRRFTAEAATDLMNYEKAMDYINFVGSEGMPVVRHAIRLNAEKSGVIGPDGNIQPNQLGRFVRRNQRMIREFGMEAEFADIAGRLRTIRNTEVRHQEAYNERAKELSNSFFKSIENNNLNTVVNKIKSNPGDRKRYISEINKLGPKEKEIVMSGLRQEFLSQGLTTKGSMQEYVNGNVEAVSDIFGSGYVKNINKLAGLRDLMENVSKTLLDSMGSSPVVDTVQDVTGVSTAEYLGTFRNQILSPERKAINLVAKASVTKGREKFYVKSAEILKDPDVVERLANPPKTEMMQYVREKGAGAIDYVKDISTFYTDALKSTVTLSTLKAIYAAQDIPVELQEGIEQERAAAL